LTLAKPNQVRVSDITYIRTDEGWLYLATMSNQLSRQTVGWQMSRRIDTPLVKDALQAALVNRGHPKGLMMHSDWANQVNVEVSNRQRTESARTIFKAVPTED
tara:strand:- start:83 stop:391 length:309 start_codon:yes stop_codon:yes gene_type:complete